MSSLINPNIIDNTFPIAGQQNSSQGFRDNYTNIKNNFLHAAAEISDLQSKAIVTSALSGQTVNNNMGGTKLTAPQLSSWTQSLLDLGTITLSATLDFSQANFQKITTGGTITLSFANWPVTTGQAGLGYATMRVWINVSSTSHTVTLPSIVTQAVSDIAGYNATTQTISFDAVGNYVYEFSSTDGGVNLLITDLTRNRSSFHDSNIYYNPAATTFPTLFLGFGQNGGNLATTTYAVAQDQGQNTISTMGSHNSVAIGNLTLGNTITSQLDTGRIGGYTITAARGNLAQLNVQAVQNNDYLGYHNVVAFTGNGNSANTFQQLSSIAFYANSTTSQLAGLGGNIAFYTSPGAQSGSQQVLQALGIESNQSIRALGNASVNGIFTTNGGLVENGTYVTTMVTTPGVYNQFVANTNISTIIIDSSQSATVPLANIILPANPVSGQKIKISAACPITTANVYMPGSIPSVPQVKWVSAGKFASGNITVQLTYLNSVWYIS